MIDIPVAHVGGIPIEETLGSYGPALLLVGGAAWTTLSAHVRNLRRRQGVEAKVSADPSP